MPDPHRGHAALRRSRASLPGHVYHVTTVTDARIPYFTDFRVARLAIRAFHQPGVLGDSELLAWALMPDHFHGLIQLGLRDDLARLMDRIKSASARTVNRHLGRTGPLWQRAYHDHLLRREEDLVTVGRYVVANPLTAGLVRRLAEYSHWDAVWMR